jgi:DNA modification methylase
MDAIEDTIENNVIDQASGENWCMYHGDSCEVIRAIPDDSIDFGIHSPPFSNLYSYSDSENDMGNCENDEEFFRHYSFLIPELLRVTVPGRLCAVHCKDLPKYANVWGTTGLIDFPGACIQEFESAGWVFHSRVTIWKCPVTERERTNNNGLLYKTVRRDTSQVRQGMADYLIVFRKPPLDSDGLMSAKPIVRPKGFERYIGFAKDTVSTNADHPSKFCRKTSAADPSIDIWRRYAEPVWWDINQTDVLNHRLATSEDDEKHICLAKGSLVLTKERGHVPIEQLEIGEHVLTHMGRWRPIIAKQKTSESAKIVSVRCQGVYDLKVTPTHKLWCRKVNKKWARKRLAKQAFSHWSQACDLDKTAFLSLKLPPVEYSDTSSDVWWIIGRWIADGHWSKARDSIHVSIGNHKLEDALNKLGAHAGFQQKLSATQIRLKDAGRELREIIEKCGEGACNKKLPPEAFTLDEEKAKSLLDGYMSGDGHFDEKRNRWSLSTVSKELAIGLQFLIQRAYGSVATIHRGRPDRKHVIEGRTVNAKEEWVVTFNVQGYSFGFVDDEGAWKPVKSVTEAGESETWNIRVEEDESYTADGCVVKNCPLQLGLIERAVDLWSAPGEVVLSPFGGIGSEGVGSLRVGRKFIGIELKREYFDFACKFLASEERKLSQPTLF